jgi:signal transduction histidine kinase/integral membrane sensor domain MASE1
MTVLLSWREVLRSAHSCGDQPPKKEFAPLFQIALIGISFPDWLRPAGADSHRWSNVSEPMPEMIGVGPVSDNSDVSPMQRRTTYALELVALALLYSVAALAGLKLDAVGGFASLVWPASGIALAAILIRGYRLWPGVMVGAFLANLVSGATLPVAFGIAVGNSLEAVAAAYMLWRIPGFNRNLSRIIDAFALIVFAALLSTALSATIGAASLYLGGIIPSSVVGETWRAWWLGDGIGDLLVAPLILVWASSLPTADRDQWLEAGTLALSGIVVGLAVFHAAPGGNQVFGEAYLFFPILIWAAVRFGQRGSVATAFLISVAAIWGTVAGLGPFVQPQLHLSLYSLQVFLGVTAATFLVLAASVSERSDAADRLQFAIAGEEQMGVERDAAHRRLLAVLEQTPLAIGIAEAPSGQLLFLNPEVERITGVRAALSSTNDNDGEWMGFRPDGTRIAPDEWPIARALHHGEVIRNEVIRIQRPGKDAVDVMTNAGPVRDADGKIVAAVVIFSDITAHRRAEDELRRAHEAAAKANRAKSEFLAVMSHELRTPLNAIGGHIQLVEMGVHGPITEAQRDALVRVQRSQRHLLSLINDLLNLARIETGRIDYNVTDVPLEPLVAEVVAMVEPLLGAHELSCEITDSPYAPNPSVVIRADREKAQQILLNLFSNAIKFTPSGGRIKIDTRCVDGPIPTAHISVSDSGVGIPPEKLDTIFEPFVQLGTRPSNPSIGLGLGLSISRDLARGMGGDLTAVSTVGEGTTFTLSIPLA